MTIKLTKDFFKFLALTIVFSATTYSIASGHAQNFINFAGVANEIGTALLFFILSFLCFCGMVNCLEIKIKKNKK